MKQGSITSSLNMSKAKSVELKYYNKMVKLNNQVLKTSAIKICI